MTKRIMTKRILVITGITFMLLVVGATATYVALWQTGGVGPKPAPTTTPGDLWEEVQTEKKAITEHVSIPIDDYYNMVTVGYLLRLPIYLDELSAELDLSEFQKKSIAEVVEKCNTNLGTPLFPKFAINDEEMDARIKEVLTPFQYVRFRDWVREGWELSKGEMGLEIEEIAKLDSFTLEFLKTRLKLSPKAEQEISTIFHQNRRNFLSLRRRLFMIVGPPYTKEEEEKEGKEIIDQIRKTNQRMLLAIRTVLSPQQLNYFDLLIRGEK